jgi:2-dehydropantoate 2-reductase
MKFVVAGAGAVGAYLGAKMAAAGEEVTLYARGPHLRAMQERGVRVIEGGSELEAHPRVSGDLKTIGIADVVFLAVKAHSLTLLAPMLAPLLGPDTVVVSMQNGVPWWYAPLERVDPGGVINAAIEPRRVVGSIVYYSTEVIEPGVVRHIAGNRISLGEPDGTRSERCQKIAEALIQAGLRSPITTHLREEIWVKLLGNVSLNPISALTRKNMIEILQDPEVKELVRNIMREAVEVAERMGMKLPVTIEQRIAGAEKVGAHKTSMLQDLEANRPLELEALVGAVLEMGVRLGVAMPCTRTVYACTKLLAKHAAAPPL